MLERAFGAHVWFVDFDIFFFDLVMEFSAWWGTLFFGLVLGILGLKMVLGCTFLRW